MKSTINYNIFFTLVFTFYFLKSNTFSQTTIWSEDFSSYANSITMGADNNTANSALDWTSGGCISCTATSSHWEVNSGLFEARRTLGDTVFLETEVIDITNGLGVEFNITISETGDLEGSYRGSADCIDEPNEDWANVFYSIDGGAYVLVSNYLNWCGIYASCGHHTLYGDDGAVGDCRTTDIDFETVSFKQSIPDGSTSLQIRVECSVSAGNERIQFDDFNVTKTSSLPVELISFDVLLNEENYVELNWNTASELNSSHFIIQKSKDLVNWAVLTEQNSIGNSSVENKYSNYDFEPYLGMSYYRLVQVDINGVSNIYSPKIVEIKTNNEKQIFTESGEIYWNVNHENINAGIINVYSINGILIDSYTISEEKTRIENVSFPKGIYLVDLISDNTKWSKKMIKF